MAAVRSSILQRPWLVALAFLALYVLVTLLAPGSLVDRTDEGLYLAYAERVADGGYAVRDTTHVHFLWYGPGLPVLLAPLTELGVSIDLVRMVGAVALALALLVFHRILRLFVSPGWAVAGMVALGLYFPL